MRIIISSLALTKQSLASRYASDKLVASLPKKEQQVLAPSQLRARMPSPMTTDTAVIGLGVTSIQLIRELEKSGHPYIVISEHAFGVWKYIEAVGENFDLVSTTESTCFSHWDCPTGIFAPDQFPFVTASEYHAYLKTTITDSINSKWVKTKVGHVKYADGTYHIFDDSGVEVVRSSSLVSSVGLIPDSDILPNLQRCLKETDKTVLIEGFSDTSNMYISRLMLNNNKVILASDHFTILDKILVQPPSLQDKLLNAIYPTGFAEDNFVPFDQMEPFQHFHDNNLEWSEFAAWSYLVSPFWSSPGAKLWRWVTGLSKLVDCDKYELPREYSPVKDNFNSHGVPAGMYLPIKYWPVDVYFKYYSKSKDHMLKSHIFLNDPLFYIKMGLLKLVKRDQVKWVSESSIELPDGSVVDVDIKLQSKRVAIRKLKITYDERDLDYEYSEFLHGIWNSKYPKLFFLGTTRPTTGSFAALGELGSVFVHKMLTQPRLLQKMVANSSRHLDFWHRHGLRRDRTFEQINHCQWSGQHGLSIARLLDIELDFWFSLKNNLLLEWLVGPCQAHRFRIKNCDDAERPTAIARYKYISILVTALYADEVIGQKFNPDLILVNCALVAAQYLPQSWVALPVAGLVRFFRLHMYAYMLFFYLHQVCCTAPALDTACTMLCVVVNNIIALKYSADVSDSYWHVAWGSGTVLHAVYIFIVSTILCIKVYKPVSFLWYPTARGLCSLGARHSLISYASIQLAAQPNLSPTLSILNRLGVLPVVALCVSHVLLNFKTHRAIFNDPRGKEHYASHYSSYLNDYKRSLKQKADALNHVAPSA